MASRKIERVKTALQIDENIDLQIKGWIIQRIGWGILVLILIASAIGLFGNGIVSERHSTRGEHILTYEYFCRFTAETQIKIHAVPNQGKVRVALPQQYLEAFKLEKIIPQPGEQGIQGNTLYFSYNTTDPLAVTLYLMPQERGGIKSTIQVNDTHFPVSHYVYP